MSRPRTATDFDGWFRQAGGDPWDYNSRSIRHRLKVECEFIRSAVGKEYSGTFLELGAFDGSCTVLLLNTFSDASFCVVDISPFAVKKAQQKIGPRENVKVFNLDFLNISRSGLGIQDTQEVVLLMLECLYYLKEGERRTCVERIRKEFPTSLVFVSAPITGGDYFTESGLIGLFADSNYEMRRFQVLNLRKAIPLLRAPLEFVAQQSSFIRSLLANQVVYQFAPEPERSRQ